MIVTSFDAAGFRTGPELRDERPGRHQLEIECRRIASSTGARDLRAMIVAVMLFIIVIGSLVFNFLSPWWFTEIASNWGGIDFAVFVTFWICGVAFVLIGLFHGLRDMEIPPSRRPEGRLRTREQEAGVDSDHRHDRRRGRHAGSGSRRVGRLRQRAAAGAGTSRSSDSNGPGVIGCRGRTAFSAPSTRSGSASTIRSAWIPKTRMARMTS